MFDSGYSNSGDNGLPSALPKTRHLPLGKVALVLFVSL